MKGHRLYREFRHRAYYWRNEAYAGVVGERNYAGRSVCTDEKAGSNRYIDTEEECKAVYRMGVDADNLYHLGCMGFVKSVRVFD